MKSHLNANERNSMESEAAIQVADDSLQLAPSFQQAVSSGQ
jgi:hypothetical protein